MRKENMTLREFLSRMKDGWGFMRSGTPAMIGDCLATLPWTEEDLATQVVVEFFKWTPRDGGYEYNWDVKGLALPEPLTIPGVDVYTQRDGFSVTYSKGCRSRI